MASRRTYGSYNDGCASAHALDLIGERWALIVVRELLLGPKRFVDLERDIPGIGPSVLTQRLGALERSGIVQRETLNSPGRVTLYALTEWGHGLEAVNAALSAWAVASPSLPWDADMSPDTVVLAMRAHARPTARSSRDIVVDLTLSDSRTDTEPVTYRANLSSTGTRIVRRSDPDEKAVAHVTATTRAWKALILSPSATIRDDASIVIDGSHDAAQALVDATRLERTLQD